MSLPTNPPTDHAHAQNEARGHVCPNCGGAGIKPIDRRSGNVVTTWLLCDSGHLWSVQWLDVA